MLKQFTTIIAIILTTQAMLSKSRLLAASLLSVGQRRALVGAGNLGFRKLSSSNVAGPSFMSPPPAARPDMTLVGPMGPLQNQDAKTSTEELSPACNKYYISLSSLQSL